MTNCVETARTPNEQRLVDIASILAAGILRLQDRQSLPSGDKTGDRGDSSPHRLELSGETVLSVVHGGYRTVRFSLDNKETHMQVNVRKEIVSMEQMAVGQLRDRYAEVFGETTSVLDQLVSEGAHRPRRPRAST